MGAAARDRAGHLRALPAAGRRDDPGAPGRRAGRPRGRRAVPLSGPEVHRGDGARGRGPRADRAAGLSLQPHVLRLRARLGAQLLRRPRAGERPGPGADARRGRDPGAPRAGRDPLPVRSRAAPRDAGAGHPLPRRDALARRGRRGRDAGRSQPPDHPAAERLRAGRGAGLDPDVRRPDGAGGGGGHHAGGSGRAADPPARRRRVLSSHHRSRSDPDHRAPRAAPGQRGPGALRRPRRRAGHRRRTAGDRGDAGQAHRPAPGARPPRRRGLLDAARDRRAAVQRGRAQRVLAADGVLPPGDLRRGPRDVVLRRRCSRWSC